MGFLDFCLVGGGGGGGTSSSFSLSDASSFHWNKLQVPSGGATLQTYNQRPQFSFSGSLTPRSFAYKRRYLHLGVSLNSKPSSLMLSSHTEVQSQDISICQFRKSRTKFADAFAQSALENMRYFNAAAPLRREN